MCGRGCGCVSGDGSYATSMTSPGVGGGRGTAEGDTGAGDRADGEDRLVGTSPAKAISYDGCRCQGFRVCIRETGEERLFEENHLVGRLSKSRAPGSSPSPESFSESELEPALRLSWVDRACSISSTPNKVEWSLF